MNVFMIFSMFGYSFILFLIHFGAIAKRGQHLFEPLNYAIICNFINIIPLLIYTVNVKTEKMNQLMTNCHT